MTFRAASRQDGFTMLELMVVILVLGLISRLVISNMGAWIPESALDSVTNQFRAHLDYLRSEAKVQGKPYTLQLDLDQHRYRLLLPEEDKLVETMDDTAASAIPLNWRALEPNARVQFDGHAIAGREIIVKGVIDVTFDDSGVTADQTIYLRYHEEESRLIWAIHLRGLNGTTEVVRNREGARDVFVKVTEAMF